MMLRAFRPIGVLCVLGVLGCGPAPGESARDMHGMLFLNFRDSQIPVPIDHLDVYLTKDDAGTETFQFAGSGVSLVGEFPSNLHVGHAGLWEALMGRAIRIDHTIDSDDIHDPSIVTLPDLGSVNVLNGTFTLDRIGDSYEGTTALFGAITLTYPGAGGDVTLTGRFRVGASTWG